MKRNILPLVLLSFIVLNLGKISAQVLCQANFTKTVNYTTRTVSLTNTSSPTNYIYYWTVGNSNIIYTGNPVVSFSANGTYQICLHMLAPDSSCSSVKCDTVVFSNSGGTNACNANWTKVKDQTNYKKYFFSAILNDTNFKYLWTFGDGTSSDNRTPFHIYAQNGNYRVCLKVTKKDSSCQQTICDSLFVTNTIPTTCNASWTRTKDASNYLKYHFNTVLNDTNYRYLWTFGDGTASDNRTPNHIYANAGKFLVCLKVSKKDSSCQQTICDSLKIESSNSPTCNANWSKRIDSLNAKKLFFYSFFK